MEQASLEAQRQLNRVNREWWCGYLRRKSHLFCLRLYFLKRRPHRDYATKATYTYMVNFLDAIGRLSSRDSPKDPLTVMVCLRFVSASRLCETYRLQQRLKEQLREHLPSVQSSIVLYKAIFRIALHGLQ